MICSRPVRAFYDWSLSCMGLTDNQRGLLLENSQKFTAGRAADGDVHFPVCLRICRHASRFKDQSRDCSSDDYAAACEPDSDGGTSCDIFSDGERRRAHELSVVHERRGCRNRFERVLDRADGYRADRRADLCGGDKCGRVGDQRDGDVDCDCCGDCADDHAAAGERDRDGGANCGIFGDGDGHRAVNVSVVPEWHGQRHEFEHVLDPADQHWADGRFWVRLLKNLEVVEEIFPRDVDADEPLVSRAKQIGTRAEGFSVSSSSRSFNKSVMA